MQSITVRAPRPVLRWLQHHPKLRAWICIAFVSLIFGFGSRCCRCYAVAPSPVTGVDERRNGRWEVTYRISAEMTVPCVVSSQADSAARSTQRRRRHKARTRLMWNEAPFVLPMCPLCSSTNSVLSRNCPANRFVSSSLCHLQQVRDSRNVPTCRRLGIGQSRLVRQHLNITLQHLLTPD